MAIGFKGWFGRSPKPHSDEDFLRYLMAAADAADFEELARLCRTYPQELVDAFPAWLQPPETLTEGSAEYHRYMNGLYSISKFAGDCLGIGGLFARLVAPDQNNPFAVWEAKINEALELNRRMEWEAGAKLLGDHLIDVRGLEGFGYAHMAATTHWYLSQYQSALGDRDGTIGHAERSLRVTREIGDHPKYVQRYLRWLWQVHRYFGEPDAAAGYACELSGLLSGFGRDAEALLYRRQAELLERGEPLTRVSATVDGQEYELEDLPKLADAKVTLNVVRNRMTLHSSLQLVEEARSAIVQDRPDEGLALLRQAAATDPHSPDPHLEAGRWLLATARFGEAVEELAECERLAPGWPGCRRFLWLAEKLAAGELEPAVLELWAAPWEAEKDAEKKLRAITAVMPRFEGLALPHLFLADHLRSMGRQTESVESYRRGLQGDGDVETRTWLLAGMGQAVADSAEKRRLLQEAVNLNGDLIASAAATLILRNG